MEINLNQEEFLEICSLVKAARGNQNADNLAAKKVELEMKDEKGRRVATR